MSNVYQDRHKSGQVNDYLEHLSMHRECPTNPCRLSATESRLKQATHKNLKTQHSYPPKEIKIQSIILLPIIILSIL